MLFLQGNDYGTQYRSGIYCHSEGHLLTAIESKKLQQCKHRRPIMTEIKRAAPFYPAEELHQQYLAKGGGNGRKQSAAKGCKDPIRCYG